MRISPSSFILICVFAASLSLASCASRINGALNEAGAADIRLQASLEPQTASLIRRMSRSLDSCQPVDAPILDSFTLAISMQGAPGIDSISLHNTGPAAVEGSIGVSNIREFLLPPGEKTNKFISYTPSGGAASGRLVISLDRASAPRLISLMSGEVAEYLEALMAPAATGEALGKAEYLVLVGSVYGQGLAAEIASARIQASIDFPAPVSGVRGGTAQGSRANFTIPLADLLVLDTPLVYEVTWK